MTTREWFASRLYHQKNVANLAWNMSDGSDLELREKARRIRERYEKLCRIIDGK